MFWVNPFGMSFRHIRQSDLILVDHQGNVVYGTKPVNRAAFVIHAAIHSARPDVSPPRTHTRRTASRSARSASRSPRSRRTPASSTTTTTSSPSRVARSCSTSKPAGSSPSKFPDGKAAIHQNHGLFTVGETVDEAAFWFISMERSCQAQLMAMAAGDPIEIRDEYATYTPAEHRVPRRRLVQLPAAVGRDLPAPIPNCSSRPCPIRCPDCPTSERSTGPVARWLDTAQPEALFVLSARRPVHRRGHRRQPVRRGRTPDGRVVPRHRRGDRRGARVACLAGAAGPGPNSWPPRLFGVVTALMNTFFYLGIDRVDLGIAVTIEFIGPITVAAVATRSRRNARRPAVRHRRRARPGRHRDRRRTRSGCCSSSSRRSMWAALHRDRITRRRPRPRRRRGSASGSPSAHSPITPIGAPGSLDVWASPRLLALCLLVGVFSNADRLRHRPVLHAPHPGAPVLAAARAAAGHRGVDRMDRPRPAAVRRRVRRRSRSSSSA